MSQPQSPLDSYRSLVEVEVEAGKTFTEIARGLTDKGVPTTRSSVKRAIRRWRTHPSPNYTLSIDENIAEFSTTTEDRYNVDDLCKERGLDPKDWEVTHLTLNEWDSPTGLPLKQLKANLKRRKAANFLDRAREVGEEKPIKVKRYEAGDLVVCLSDQHAPHHDPELHQQLLEWLRENQPEHGLVLGDLLDFPEVSRYRYDPEWSVPTQQCLDQGYKVLSEYIEASPDTHWQFCAGNHEFRLQKFVIERAREIWGLKPGGKEEDGMLPVLSLKHLLRLNELGVHFVEAPGSYEFGKIRLNSNLGAAHGHKSPKGSGNSVLRTIEQFHHSMIVGHCHRLALVSTPVYDMDGNAKILMGAENGCLCKIEGGLGHAVNPNWVNGFTTATLLQNDSFHLELAQYQNKTLQWRGEQYR